MENKCPDKALRMSGMNLNLCILRMLEDTISLGAAYIDLVAPMNIASLRGMDTLSRQTMLKFFGLSSKTGVALKKTPGILYF